MHRYNICIYYGHTYIRTDMHTCTWYMNIEDILKPSGLYSIYLHSTLWWRLALVLKTDRRATKSLKFKPSNILSILWTHKKKPKKPRNFAPTLKEIKERNVSSELRKILRFLPETRDWRRIQEQTRTHRQRWNLSHSDPIDKTVHIKIWSLSEKLHVIKAFSMEWYQMESRKNKD